MGKNQPLTPWPLILASTSKYRGALLAQLGFPFESIAPGVDEDQFKQIGLNPADLALKLSEMKAHSVATLRPDACIIGSDQVCHLDGQILGKPGSFEKARDQLLRMQGKTHELLTAVTVIGPGNQFTFLSQESFYVL